MMSRYLTIAFREAGRYTCRVKAHIRASVWAGLVVMSMVRAAAEPELVEWSQNRKLTRADFQSRSPLPRGVMARSFVAVDAAWACDHGTFEPRIRAVFDPARSSWHTASIVDASNARQPVPNDRDVLQHEQVHFDIAELVARQIRTYFASLSDICTRPGGMIPLRAVVEDYRQSLDEQQSRYDRETLFGIDGRVQSIWSTRIAADLKR